MHTDPVTSKDMSGAPLYEIRLSRETAGGCVAAVPYECCGKLVSECSQMHYAGVISQRYVKNYVNNFANVPIKYTN